MWRVRFENNTDYPHGVEFCEAEEVREFVKKYYKGEAGDQYMERWTVEGDYPLDLLDILTPIERPGGGWKRK